VPSRTPADWHALHAELERLLAEGQAAPVRLLIQARFLRAVLPQGEAVWAAYGFPVARSFAQRIGGESVCGADGFIAEPARGRDGLLRKPVRGGEGFTGGLARCGDRFLGELEEALHGCAGRSAPPWARETEWKEGLEAAARALRRERKILGKIVAGGGPPEFSTRPDGTPAEVTSAEVRPAEGVPAEATPAEGSAELPLGSSSVLVPVVLGVQSDRRVPEFFQGIRASCLVRFTVEAQLLYRRARGAELTVQGSADPQTVAGFEEAAAFLGRLAPPGTPSLGHYWFRVHWDLPGARLTGRSATLGFFLAAQSAHASFSLALGQHALAGGVAVTGDVRDGTIAPVGSIADKIRACFYSEVRAVVVPAEQRDEAVREVRILEQSHPGRQLLVLAAGRVSDLWNEPAVAVVRTRSLQELLRAMLRRVAVSRALVAVFVGLFLLVAGFGGREFWLQRPWPAGVQWDGEDLVFRNASGRAYRREHLPPGTPRHEAEAYNYRASRVAAALDLDGQPPNEVAVIRWNPGFEGNNLQARNGRGRLLWTLPSQVDLADSPLATERLNWRFFANAGSDRSGELRLLAVRRSLYGSLTLVDLVHARNGRRLGLLANQGHLGRLLAEDVDLDGRIELLVAGTENTDDVGLLAIVDPDGMQMPPPSWTKANLAWMTRPEALGQGVRAAVRLPKDRLLPAGRPDCLEGLMENGLLRVTTETEMSGRNVIFSLDFHDVSHPLAVRALVTDSYRNMLATRASGLSSVDISREQERLLHGITYLTPQGWQPAPVRVKAGENHSAEEAGRD
jgi:hypothetical protein